MPLFRFIASIRADGSAKEMIMVPRALSALWPEYDQNCNDMP